MFGYITILKEELKIRDYNIFRAYYCGLCKALGKNFSHLTRAGLSYDLTFLAILLSAVTGEDVVFKKERCFVHPAKKRSIVKGSGCVEYAANIAVILAYLKFQDDFNDEKNLLSLLKSFLYKGHCRKARKRYGRIYDEIKEKLELLSRLEKENCREPDAAAEAAGESMAACFVPDFCPEDQKRQLWWLGYNIGRWIYLLDAFNDIEKDIKFGSYNPLVSAYGANAKNKDEIRKKLEFSLSFSLENAAKSYELLDIKANDAILRNILYCGLIHRQEEVLGGKNIEPV